MWLFDMLCVWCMDFIFEYLVVVKDYFVCYGDMGVFVILFVVEGLSMLLVMVFCSCMFEGLCDIEVIDVVVCVLVCDFDCVVWICVW